MYRLFAHNRKISVVHHILCSNVTEYIDFFRWRCSISSYFPINGYFEFDSFTDFLSFVTFIYDRYPYTLITIYFKS